MDKKLRIDHDSSWKKIITNLLPHFMEFFLPKLHEDIDYTKGYEFLSTELSRLIPNKDKRQVDLLVKVFLKNNKSKLLYIHIEVQSYFDMLIRERMFEYYCRIRYEHGKSIVAILIFTGENVNKAKNPYIYESYDTKIRYDYKTYEVRKQVAADLEANQNPFSLVVLACLFLIDDLKSTKKELERQKNILKSTGQLQALADWEKRKKQEYDYTFRSKLKQKILELYIERGKTNKLYTEGLLTDLLIFIDHILILPEKKNRLLFSSFTKRVEHNIKNKKDMTITNQNRFILAAFLRAIGDGMTIDEFIVINEQSKRTKVAEEKAKQERLARIAEQKKAEQERLARIVEQKKAEKERLARIAEQKKAKQERLARIAEQKKVEKAELAKRVFTKTAVIAFFKKETEIEEIATILNLTVAEVRDILKNEKLI